MLPSWPLPYQHVFEGHHFDLLSTMDRRRGDGITVMEGELPIELARTLAAIPSNAIAGDPRSIATSSPHAVAAAPSATAITPIVRNAMRYIAESVPAR